MSLIAQILTIGIALSGFALVLVLVRRRMLKERFAVTWLVVGVGMIVLALARPLLDRLSESLGIQSGITTVFLIAILVILGIQLQLSVSVSRIEERIRDLAEAFALTDPMSGIEPRPPIEESDERHDDP